RHHSSSCHRVSATPTPPFASVNSFVPGAAMNLLEDVQAFFRQLPLDRGDRLVVAFSGGGDSAALLWALAQLAPCLGIRLVAAHLDHAMDAGSRERAARAAVLARRLRYQFLEEVRRGCGARYVATAHHRDDQAETVLLRLHFGSGLRGLAAIRPAAGTVVRPLLGLSRASLRQAVAAAGLTPCEDPGNGDLRQPRSRMRHQIMPALARADAAAAAGGGAGRAAADPDSEAGLAAALARLAARAQRALPALDRRLAAAIGLGGRPVAAGVAVAPFPAVPAAAAAAADRRRLAALPAPLLSHALAVLHRRAGVAMPASLAAATELRRQLQPRDRRTACDCGAGWRWQAAGELLVLRRTPPDETVPPFTYTVEFPGELTIPEIGLTIRVSRSPVEAWMLRGAPLRAGLALPLPAAGLVTVRNRRPGDRLRPLGSPGSRKLKEVLIDRGVPRWQRDRLPLLCWAGEIAWVPGITIDHRFRLTGQARVCLAEIVA
ncbi:MAG TPA: tRNA lysidine(34) synthetase TilS, partial [Thermoanaerobaculia bacterium]|nr:tRNA lysidine(34) synthetase TilS [Thermoanaerobaculia bacterium]